jgi:uncharacterized protein
MQTPGVLKRFSDKLVNLVANLGTERDKAASSYYAVPILTEEQAVNAYRGAWLPRKIVDVPAMDATRKWRAWQADKKQIEKIEAEEKRLKLRQKVKEAMIKARLHGGAAIFLGTGDRDPSKPLRPESMGKSDLKYLVVLTKRNLKPGELERDVLKPGYGKPVDYVLSSSSTPVRIHPSRLIVFHGAALPDPDLPAAFTDGWGDSVLTAVMQAISHSDSTMANIASLVFEAKVDVIRIPDFMANLETNPKYAALVQERLSLAAAAKGINGMLLLDKEEEYETKTTAFTGLPDVVDRFLQAVSGASDIPATRLLGQSPAGLSATGESDERNYYDRIQAMQELEISPAMEIADECLIRSALGSRPREMHYVWNVLWQPTAKERSEIGKATAETIKLLTESNLFNRQALSQASATLLVEGSVVPGLEAALEEHGDAVPPEKEAAPAAASGKPAASGKKKVADAAPRSLYVSRKVTNAAAILKWAKEQGFTSTLPAEDLHVTVAFSRDPVDWMAVGNSWSGGDKGTLLVSPGGPRLVEKFGGGAVVLLFGSSELSWRHRDIVDQGASWDWPDYNPHITITYEPGDVDLSKVEPYRGKIELGPEVFAEVDEDWKSNVKEEGHAVS